MESAVMDTGDCQPLYHAIRDYYEGLHMKLDQQIPMLLVQRQALNEAIFGEKNVMYYLSHTFKIYWLVKLLLFRHGSFQGYHHMPETRGLCLSEEQTVASVWYRITLVFGFILTIRVGFISEEQNV